MKIIFLDVDGVLNNSETTDRIDGFTGLDPLLIANFNRITAAVPDAKIVISSTWRKALPFMKAYTDFDGLKRLLAERGLKGEIIGHTPINFSYVTRGGEIRMWLESAEAKAVAPITDFVVIDDDAEGMRRHPKPRKSRWQDDEEFAEELKSWGSTPDLRAHHVRTFGMVGLTEAKADLAVQILNGHRIPLEDEYDEEEE